MRVNCSTSCELPFATYTHDHTPTTAHQPLQYNTAVSPVSTSNIVETTATSTSTAAPSLPPLASRHGQSIYPYHHMLM